MINSQPVVLGDDVLDTNHVESIFRKIVTMILSKKKVNCQTAKTVLRYHELIPHKSIEQYAHYLLFTFYIFCQE